MIRKSILLTICVFVFTAGFAQKTQHFKSKSKYYNIQPAYERGLPPNLFVEYSFLDENQNGILEATETGYLNLKITNKGKGPAQGLEISVLDDVNDAALRIDDKQEIPFIFPDSSKTVVIPISAGLEVQSAKHSFMITVSEHFHYDMDTAYLILNSLKYQEPQLVFSGMDVIDYGENTVAIFEDGQLQAGEQVKIKLVIQNIGQNMALNTSYRIVSEDKNIFIIDGAGDLGDIGIGEVKEFEFYMSPNKRVKTSDKLPVFMTLQEDIGKGSLVNYQLPVFLNQKPPETEIVEVVPNRENLDVAIIVHGHGVFKTNVGNIIDIHTVKLSVKKIKHSVGVVIGIEKYTELPPAPYADNDAEIMKKYFEETFGIEQVVLYTNEDVSGFIFDDIFNPDNGELQKAILKGESDLFVFYSGHGIPSKDGQNIYLFPSDGKISRLQTQGYNINTLYENLEKLEARSVTVFLDACFSGASRTTEKHKTENLVAMKGIKVKPKTLEPWQNNENFIVFTSSSGEETSLGFDVTKTGLFTYFLCAGLQGKADLNNDREITAGELDIYLHENVTKTSRKISGLQTPVFHGKKEKVLVKY